MKTAYQQALDLMLEHLTQNRPRVCLYDMWRVFPHDSTSQPSKAVSLAMKVGISVIHENRAYYEYERDFIVMPPLPACINTATYDALLLHELIHWTGHVNRLDRLQDSHDNDKEECIAELGSAFLCSVLGIELEALHHCLFLKAWSYRSDANIVEYWKSEIAPLAAIAADFVLESASN